MACTKKIIFALVAFACQASTYGLPLDKRKQPSQASTYGLPLAPLTQLEDSAAHELIGAWGINSSLSFLSVSGGNEIHSLILGNPKYDSLAVALLSNANPQRRNVSSGETFVDASRLNPGIASAFGLEALNQGAVWIEAAIGRPLFPFRLIPVAVNQSNPRRPYAVWDVGRGDVYLDERILQESSSHFMIQNGFVRSFAEALTHRMGQFIVKTGHEGPATAVGWSKLVAGIVSSSLGIAAALHVPLWFCLACPVVLGLLAPFAFNLGFGAAANLICQHYQLPTEECNDLWYGAFALAMVLSLASAIPIVYICQLPKCGRQLW